MSQPVVRRIQGLFWHYSPLLRRPARRLLRSLSVLAYRWRNRGGAGEPPRVLTDLDRRDAAALESPAIAVAENDDAWRSFLDHQTEDSVTRDPGAPYLFHAETPPADAPATLLESLLLAAAAGDLAWTVGGWAAPAPGRHGPTDELYVFDATPAASGAPEAPILVRLPRSTPPEGGAVLGRLVPHLHAAPAGEPLEQPTAGANEPRLPAGRPFELPTVATSGANLLRDDVAPGTVVRHRVRAPDAVLRALPDVPGPRTALFLLPYLAVGGAERLLHDLLAGWRDRYRLLVVTLEPHRASLGQTVDVCRAITPHVYTLGDWLPRAARPGALRHLVRRWRVETLVSWNGTVAFYDRAAELKRAFPGLRILHQLYNHRGGWIERMTPEHARAIDVHLAVNRRIADALEHDRGVAPERIALVHHGVAVPDPLPAGERAARKRSARETLGIPRDAFVAGTFIRLHPQKRPLDVLALAERLAGSGLHFLLVGGGPLDAEIDRRLAARPLANLTRLPMRRDARALYDAVDVGLMTSDYEGLPVFLLDALARAVPCVAPAVGEIPLLLEDGGGVLVEHPGDLDALASALLALRDPARRAAEGARGRNTVAERFGLDAYRARYEPLVFPPPESAR